MNSPTDLELMQRQNPRITLAQAKEWQERSVAYDRYLRKQRDGLRYRVRSLNRAMKALQTENAKWRKRDAQLVEAALALQTENTQLREDLRLQTKLGSQIMDALRNQIAILKAELTGKEAV
jgi:hypothetical protein